MANALSLLRLCLAPVFGFFMLRPGANAACVACVLLCVAIGTDLLDGAVARRRGTVSARGRALDHFADFLFVTVGLAAMAWRGALSWALPALIVVAFAQYWLDASRDSSGRELRMSRLGRTNGVLYFVPLGGDLLARLGLPGLGTAVRAVAWLLVLTTLGSMLDRLLAGMHRSRTAPGSRDAQR